MSSYYSDKLSASRLKQAYDIAPPRVQQYLDAEIDHVCRQIHPGDTVLELGCGYGRVLSRLVEKAGLAIGIDIAMASLLLGRRRLRGVSNCRLLQMNAVQLAFGDQAFDVVVCIQNGISAFHVDQKALLRESVRVTKAGGSALFSSYSDRFWQPRLRWFELQAEAGLLGEIDWQETRDGVIACEDGFTATTVGADEFRTLTSGLDVDTRIVEVDDSSVFCEITPRRN